VVALRPQAVQIGAAGTGIPGRLEFRRFLGEIELLELAVQGLDRPIRARVRRAGDLRLKSEVGINVDPAEVLVFAAAGA
jgi:iron(III) transport system ATP-binding protein